MTMSEVMVMENRKHPDLFTPEEAVAYLHLDPEVGSRTLETLREKYGLVGQPLGRGYMYHRANLDALVARIFGGPEKIGGRKAR